MRISEVSVTDLFGIFNHIVPLNLEERVTIIVGPNGFGKTTVLGMLDNLLNGRFEAIRVIPFRNFQVDLDDGRSLQVSRRSRKASENGRERPGDAPLTIRLLRSGKVEQSATMKPILPEGEPFPLYFIEIEIPELNRVGDASWRYSPTGEVLDLEEVLLRFGEHFPPSMRLLKSRDAAPEWLSELRSEIGVRFIESQRLLNVRFASRNPYLERRNSTIHMIPAVDQYSAELAQTIEAKLAESVALAQTLDRSFPSRAVAEDQSSSITDEQLRNELAALERKRMYLMETGLLDAEQDVDFHPEHIDSRTKSILSVYVRDTQQKLGVFDDLSERIDLLMSIVNRRFFYKRMTVSKLNGFSFSTIGNTSLPSSALSSGEQHELILLYELLFRVETGTLILIDEPELSLHVAWQVEFLKDLLEIAQLRSLDVVLATHSPQIINDRWDLAVELNGPDR